MYCRIFVNDLFLDIYKLLIDSRELKIGKIIKPYYCNYEAGKTFLEFEILDFSFYDYVYLKNGYRKDVIKTNDEIWNIYCKELECN